MFDLSNKTALVTGATGAIGSAIVRALHKQGAVVVATGTNKEKLEKMRNEFSEGFFSLVCDLNDSEKVKCLVQNAEGLSGNSIDLLVNNAGITADGLAMRMLDDSWEKVLNVNLEVPFRLSKAVIRGMMKNRFGRIINISSIVGFVGNAGQTNYCASKAGLVGMSKALAIEVASRGITVNCVAPGFIDSPMVDAIPEKIKENMLNSIPMKRTGTPDDVAACVAFLASDEAAYITGHTIHVNGGMAMI